MAYNFLPVDRDQQFLLPVDMTEWLPRDHFAHFLIELVDELDTTPFLTAYRADGRGGAAHHPAMMATLLMYAYYDGERSSRRIEEHCRTDIAYRFITGGLVPDHSTMARFRDRHENDLTGIITRRYLAIQTVTDFSSRAATRAGPQTQTPAAILRIPSHQA